MQNEKNPQFRQPHPTLVALKTAMDTLQAARIAYGNTVTRLHQRADAIEPTSWTERIEKALDKPDEIEQLRIEFDELNISLMSMRIKVGIERQRFSRARGALCDRIRAVIAANDAIDAKSADAWLKPIMAGATIAAGNEHKLEAYDRSYDTRHESLWERAERIMHAAFLQLAEELSCSTCNPAYYPDTVVVQDKRFSNRDVDLRSVGMVDFVDCVNSKHPNNAELASLGVKLEEMLREACTAASLFRYENGFTQTCEPWHADRLIEMLHGKPGKSCGYRPEKAQAAVEAQNERRWQYELARHDLLTAIRNLKNAREAVVIALRAAIVEAAPFVEHTRQRSSAKVCITVDQYDTARIIMNNCLAADLRLRFIGREIRELDRLFLQDPPGGAGAKALATKYEEAAAFYRPWFLKTETGKDGGDSPKA